LAVRQEQSERKDVEPMEALADAGHHPWEQSVEPSASLPQVVLPGGQAAASAKMEKASPKELVATSRAMLMPLEQAAAMVPMEVGWEP
jgi:hypothetical protein